MKQADALAQVERFANIELTAAAVAEADQAAVTDLCLREWVKSASVLLRPSFDSVIMAAREARGLATALVALVYGFGIVFPSTVSAASNCLSLSSSSACPDFTSYYISTTDPTGPQSVADFDTLIENNLLDTINGAGCSLTTSDQIRYLKSAFCGLYVDTATSDGCNSDTKKQLCSSTVGYFLSTLGTVFDNTTACPTASTSSSDLISSFTTFNSRLTTDDPDYCYIGENDEGTQCGFTTSDAALNYCNNEANGLDQCCSQVSGYTGTVAVATPPTSTTSTKSTSAAATASSSSSASKASSSSSSSSSSMYIIIAVVAVAAIVIVVVAVVLIRRRSAKKAAATKRDYDQFSYQPGQGSSSIGRAAGGVSDIPQKVRPRPETQEDVFRPHANNKAAEASYNISNSAPTQPLPTYQQNAAYPPRPGSPTRGNRDMTHSDQRMSPQQQFQQPSGYGQSTRDFPQNPQANQGIPASRFDEMPAPTPFGAPVPSSQGVSQYAGALPPGIGAVPVAANVPAKKPGDGETYEVVYNYVPQLSDEVYLYVGDPVVLQCQFDDGWGFGLNLTTREEGSFPLACLATFADAAAELISKSGQSVSANDPSIRDTINDPEAFSIRAKKRASSMFGPPPSMRSKGQDDKYSAPTPIAPGSRAPPARQEFDRASVMDPSKYHSRFDSMYEPMPAGAGSSGFNKDSQYYGNTDSQFYGKGVTDSQYYDNGATDSQYYGKAATDSQYYGKGATDSQYYGNNTDSLYYGNTDSQYYGKSTDSQYYDKNTDSQYFGANNQRPESDYSPPASQAKASGSGSAAFPAKGSAQGGEASIVRKESKSSPSTKAAADAPAASGTGTDSQFFENADPQAFGRATDSQYYGNNATDSQYYGNNPTDSQYYGDNATDSQYYGKNATDSQYYDKNATDSQYYGKGATDSQYYGNNTDSQYYGNTDSQYYGKSTDSQYYGNNTDSQYYGNNTDSQYYGNNTDSMYFDNNGAQGGDGAEAAGGRAAASGPGATGSSDLSQIESLYFQDGDGAEDQDDGAGGRKGYDSRGWHAYLVLVIGRRECARVRVLVVAATEMLDARAVADRCANPITSGLTSFPQDKLVQNVEQSFTAQGNFKGEKILGGILGAVAVAGVGYLGYE
ncbi:hypothetical protein HK405_004912, partial [Cladochytrium tenue]